MGSPERGRYPSEGPQHEVTITGGYWLAEFIRGSFMRVGRVRRGGSLVAVAAKKPNDPTPIHGGFATTHFCGDLPLKATSASPALHPARAGRAGHLSVHRQADAKRVVWAKSY